MDVFKDPSKTEKEKLQPLLNLAKEADIVFSVGANMFDYFSTEYKALLKQPVHYEYIPPLSKYFLEANSLLQPLLNQIGETRAQDERVKRGGNEVSLTMSSQGRPSYGINIGGNQVTSASNLNLQLIRERGNIEQLMARIEGREDELRARNEIINGIAGGVGAYLGIRGTAENPERWVGLASQAVGSGTMLLNNMIDPSGNANLQELYAVRDSSLDKYMDIFKKRAAELANNGDSNGIQDLVAEQARFLKNPGIPQAIRDDAAVQLSVVAASYANVIYEQFTKVQNAATNAQLTSLTSTVGKWVSVTQQSKEAIATLQEGLVATNERLDTVIAQCNKIGKVISQNTADIQSLKSMTSYLFSQAMTVLNQGLSYNGEVNEILTDYQNAKDHYDSLPDGSLEKLTAQAELIQMKQDADQLIGQKLAKYEASMSNLNAVGDVAGIVGGIVSLLPLNPEAKQVIQQGIGVVQGAVGIAKNIVGITSGVISGFMGGVGIATAVISLVGMFIDTGPSTDQMILDNINALSKQVADGFKYMDQRFDRIETILSKSIELQYQIREDIRDLRIDIYGISKQLDSFYRSSLENFQLLYDNQIQIESMISDLYARVQSIDSKLDTGFGILVTQRYTELKDEMLSYHSRYPYPENKMGSEKLQGMFSIFVTAAVKNAKEYPLGEDTSYNTDPINRIYDSIDSSNMLYKINFLRRYLEDDYGLTRSSAVVNPIAWTEAAETVMNFLTLMPEYKITKTIRPDIQDIINNGDQFLRFVNSIKSSMLLNKLVTNYENQLTSLILVIHNLQKDKIPRTPGQAGLLTSYDVVSNIKSSVTTKIKEIVALGVYNRGKFITETAYTDLKQTFEDINNNAQCSSWSPGSHPTWQPYYYKSQQKIDAQYIWQSVNCINHVKKLFVEHEAYQSNYTTNFPSFQSYVQTEWEDFVIYQNGTTSTGNQTAIARPNMASFYQGKVETWINRITSLRRSLGSLNYEKGWLDSPPNIINPYYGQCFSSFVVDNLISGCLTTPANLQTKFTSAIAAVRTITTKVNEFDNNILTKVAALNNINGMTCGRVASGEVKDIFNTTNCAGGYMHRMQFGFFEIFAAYGRQASLNHWFNEVYQNETLISVGASPNNTRATEQADYENWIKSRLQDDANAIFSNGDYQEAVMDLDKAKKALITYLQLAFGDALSIDTITQSVLNYLPSLSSMTAVANNYHSDLASINYRQHALGNVTTMSFVTKDVPAIRKTIADFRVYLTNVTNDFAPLLDNGTLFSGYLYIENTLQKLKDFINIFTPDREIYYANVTPNDVVDAFANNKIEYQTNYTIGGVIDSRDETSGNTASMKAILVGNVGVLTALTNAYANLTLTNNDHKTLMDFALDAPEISQYNIIKLLVDKQAIETRYPSLICSILTNIYYASEDQEVKNTADTFKQLYQAWYNVQIQGCPQQLQSPTAGPSMSNSVPNVTPLSTPFNVPTAIPSAIPINVPSTEVLSSGSQLVPSLFQAPINLIKSIVGFWKPAIVVSHMCSPVFVGDQLALKCTGGDYTTYVFSKLDAEHPISGDNYSNCQPIEFAGIDSVTCNGEYTTLVYQPQKPFNISDLNSVLLLANLAVSLLACHDAEIGKEREDIADTVQLQAEACIFFSQLQDEELRIQDALKGRKWSFLDYFFASQDNEVRCLNNRLNTLSFLREELEEIVADGNISRQEWMDFKIEVQSTPISLPCYNIHISQPEKLPFTEQNTVQYLDSSSGYLNKINI